MSREETAEADGYTDVHFRVKVKFPRPVEVRSITLRAAGEGDRPLEPGYGTLDPEGPLLVVEQGGRRLNEGFSNRLTRIEDEATLDLYLGDNGTLNLESRVLVEIAIEDGPIVRRAFTLAPPANRLLGTWQVHCAPGPTAFEPMTLSGRLWIDLGEGGEVTGYQRHPADRDRSRRLYRAGGGVLARSGVRPRRARAARETARATERQRLARVRARRGPVRERPLENGMSAHRTGRAGALAGVSVAVLAILAGRERGPRRCAWMPWSLRGHRVEVASKLSEA